MNVLHLIDTLGRGGSETLLLDLCRNAHRFGINITLLATGGGELEQDFRQTPVHFYRVDRTKAFDKNIIQYTQRIIQEQNIHLLHSHQPVSGLHALQAARKQNIPLIHSIHGFTEDLKNKMAFRYLVHRTSANILVSHAMESMSIEREWVGHIPNAHVVYNGVDQMRVQPVPSSLRSELGINKSDIVLGMVGNFYGVKDQLTVIKAIKELVHDYPQLHLVFAGRAHDAELYNNCVDYTQRNGLSERVHFLGGRQDVANVLGALDIFVFSTLWDTFGLALVEAMLLGIPCIVSDIPVMREMSFDNRYARLFKTKDAPDLASQIRALLQNTSERTALGIKALDWAQRRFTIDAHIRELHKVYEGVCNNAGHFSVTAQQPITADAQPFASPDCNTLQPLHITEH